MKKTNIILFAVIFIPGNYLFGKSPSLKIQITPPIYEREVRQGEKLSFQILLQNNSSKEVRLKAGTLGFQIAENGKPVFIDDTYLRFSCQSWIDIKPKSFQIRAGEGKEVSISIKVPKNASGGNYASVLFDVDTGDLVQKGNQVGLTIRTGTMVLLIVRNTIKLDAKIESFRIAEQPGKSIFEVLLKNNSNIHIKPIGNVVIFNDKNRVVDRINLNENSFISPQSTRLFKFVWKNHQKRMLKNKYEVEYRFYVKGLGKSFIVRKDFIPSR